MTRAEAISRTVGRARETGRSYFVVWYRGYWHDRVSLEEVNHGVFKHVESAHVLEVRRDGTVVGDAS